MFSWTARWQLVLIVYVQTFIKLQIAKMIYLYYPMIFWKFICNILAFMPHKTEQLSMKFIWSFFFQLFKIIYFVDVISSHDIQTA